MIPKRKIKADSDIAILNQNITRNTINQSNLDISATPLDTLAAPTDNTNLNATTGKHGLLPKGDADANHFLRGDLVWTEPPGGGATYATPALTLGTTNSEGNASTGIRSNATILTFDTTHPAALGTAAEGTATTAARRDHVHPVFDATQSDVSGSRSWGSGNIYQNTTGKAMMAMVSAYNTGAGITIGAYVGSSSPPGSIGQSAAPATNKYASITFMVPNDYYYYMAGNVTVTYFYWIEWTIG